MNEGNSFPFSPHSRSLIDQPHAPSPASLKRRIEIRNRKADVMDSRASLCHKFSDWRIRPVCLEQLNQRFARLKCSDPGTVGIGYRHLVEPEYLPVKGHGLAQAFQGYSNVRNPR